MTSKNKDGPQRECKAYLKKHKPTGLTRCAAKAFLKRK